MKIRCRRCDICGMEMDGRDFQFWVKPKVKFGYPALGMKHYDVCNNCFAELQVLIEEKIKRKESSEEP